MLQKVILCLGIVSIFPAIAMPDVYENQERRPIQPLRLAKILDRQIRLGKAQNNGPASLITGFEAADGFAPGPIQGQAGWIAFGADDPEGHIDVINPASGTQHLRISKDSNLAVNTFTGAFAPNLGPLPTGPSTTSVDVAIGRTGGADYRVAGVSLSEGFVGPWEVVFGFEGTIFILDDLGGAEPEFVDSGVPWDAGPYRNLTVCDDPSASTTNYYYDGVLFYSQTAHLTGTRVEQLVLVSDNFQLTEAGDFDNVSITSGLTGLCTVVAPPPDLLPEKSGLAKQRFVSLIIPAKGAGNQTAIRFELTQLHTPATPPDAPDFSAMNGQFRYLNTIHDPATNEVVTDCIDSVSLGTSYPCAIVGCTPEYRDWATLLGGGVVSVTGDAIVPTSRYNVVQLAAVCEGNEPACSAVSQPLPITTSDWGDADGDATRTIDDVVKVVDRVKDLAFALTEPHVLVHAQKLDPARMKPNVLDISLSVDALRNLRYPFVIDACP